MQHVWFTCSIHFLFVLFSFFFRKFQHKITIILTEFLTVQINLNFLSMIAFFILHIHQNYEALRLAKIKINNSSPKCLGRQVRGCSTVRACCSHCLYIYIVRSIGPLLFTSQKSRSFDNCSNLTFSLLMKKS